MADLEIPLGKDPIDLLSEESSSIECHARIFFSYTNQDMITSIANARLTNNNTSFILNDALDYWNEHLSSITLTNYTISLYDSDLKNYVHIGKMPLNHLVYCQCTPNAKTVNITLKLREIVKKEGMLRMGLLEEENDIIDEEKANIFISAKSKRAKERKIGDIIRKVYMWRRLYSGYIDENHREIKLSLEEAAVRIGISKKSLDDYLIQLRLGKLAGFNFNEHKNDKVGKLRGFVKKQRSLKDYNIINTLNNNINNDNNNNYI